MKPTVGEQLRSARESRGLTLEDAVKAINIRRDYLLELENDHPELLHSDAQARGFLRLYASWLGLPAAPLIEAWDNPPVQAAPEADAMEVTPPEEGAPEREADIPEAEVPGAVEEEAPATEKDEVMPSEEEGESGGRLQEALQRIPKLSQFLPKKGEGDEKPKRRWKREREVPKEEAATPALRASREILADIGSALRERREALELTLNDAETFTSVKRMYLEAMEAGKFERLPSTVQGRGMLNNYSRFLALDETWIMDAYAKSLQSLRAEKEAARPRKAPPPLTVQLNIPERWRRILNPDLIIGGLFIIGLFAFIIWGGAQVFSSSEPTETSAPSISEMLAQTPTPTGAIPAETNGNGSAAAETTAIPGVAIAQATPTILPTVNAAPLQVYIIVSDRAFLRVEVDGVEAYDGRVEPDDVFTFSGDERITLLTGNGAALEVYFNQEYLGGLGRVGEVVDISFSLQGLSTPTPLPTRTPTPDLGPAEEDVMDAMEEG